MSQLFLIVLSVICASAFSFMVGMMFGTYRTDKKFDKYLAVFDKEIMGYISRDPNELLAEQRHEATADVVDLLKYRAMRELQDREDDE